MADPFARAPIVELRVRRMAGHAVEPHPVAGTHAHRVLAFADACRLYRGPDW